MKAVESPIETILRESLDEVRAIDWSQDTVEFETIGGDVHRPDFLINPVPWRGRGLIVECDGAEFHDYHADRIRDQQLLHSQPDYWAILRFQGKDLHIHREHCMGTLVQWLRHIDNLYDAISWVKAIQNEPHGPLVRARFPLAEARTMPTSGFCNHHMDHPFEACVYGAHVVWEFRSFRYPLEARA